jgi:membrane protein implicated in regulation of membrane protease activity
MSQKVRTAAPGLGMFGGAGVAGLCAAGALTAFLVLVLSLFLPEWAAALIVGAVLSVAAYVFAKQGKERVADAGKPVPEQTIETVKEDVEWAKTRASSARR